MVIVQLTMLRLLEEQAAEVERLELRVVGAHFPVAVDKFGVSHDIVEFGETHLCQILAHLLGQEGEVVDEELILADEVLAQFGILGGHTQRTGIEVALAHHHAAENNQTGRAETEFLGTEQCHEDDVTSGLELAVDLQPHLTSQTVLHQGLLGLAQSDFRRDTGEAHARGRAGACTAFGTGDDDEVGLGLGHTGRNGTHTALCHKFYADSGLRVHVLQVEDKLGQVLDGVDVMMGRR